VLTGWIDSGGNHHPCDDYDHCQTYEALGKTYDDLEREGWIHVGFVSGVRFLGCGKPNQAQLNTLWDLSMEAMKRGNEWLANDLSKFFERREVVQG
jgi:hypothetical protein